jgi:L-asparaginase
MNILLITTGGTIDGADLEKGTTRAESALIIHIRNDPAVRAEIKVLCNKDSREITDNDRSQLLNLVQNSSCDRTLIGHGTFTICETGRFLKKHLAGTSKSILLVGSWIPFGEPNSDAPQQARDALNFLKDTPKGVFVAMDGKLWDPDITDKQEVSRGKWALKSTASKPGLA